MSSDPGRLQRAWILRTLQDTYWSGGRPEAAILKAIDASSCFGAYDVASGNQIGFARVVSDGATFAWLCDVVVDPVCRGRGIGKKLVEAVLADPRFAGATFHLGTRDAHGLYEKYGFVKCETMRRAGQMPLS